MCGGQAIAELIFGKTMDRNLLCAVEDENGIPGLGASGSLESEFISFTGKTCMTWPRYDSVDERAGSSTVETVQGQLPYVNTFPVVGRFVRNIDYHYYHGYRWFDRPELVRGSSENRPNNSTPRYWFGYGLSYNTYEYSNLDVDPNVRVGDKTKIKVTVNIKNTGTFKADEIVQAYISFENSELLFDKEAKHQDETENTSPAWGRPVKQLFAFDRVTLSPGDTKTVTMYIDPEDLTYWDRETRKMKLEDIAYKVIVSPSSDPNTPNKLVSSSFKLNSIWSNWFK
jgi:hypothetical protein